MKDKLLHLLLLPQKKRVDAWWAFLDFGGTICHIEYAALIHLESHIRLPVSRRDQSKRSHSVLPPEPYDPADPLILIMYVANRDAIWIFWQELVGKPQWRPLGFWSKFYQITISILRNSFWLSTKWNWIPDHGRWGDHVAWAFHHELDVFDTPSHKIECAQRQYIKWKWNMRDQAWEHPS